MGQKTSLKVCQVTAKPNLILVSQSLLGIPQWPMYFRAEPGMGHYRSFR